MLAPKRESDTNKDRGTERFSPEMGITTDGEPDIFVTSKFICEACDHELRCFHFFNVEDTEEGEIDEKVNNRGDDQPQHDGQRNISPGILDVLNVGRDSLPASIGPVSSIDGFHVITLETSISSQCSSVGCVL